MSNHRFKVGQRVIRVILDTNNHCIGDILTIRLVTKTYLRFEEIRGGYSPRFYEPVNLNPPHKHCELIKAWADGAEIEFRFTDAEPWTPSEKPSWLTEVEYRIKGEVPELSENEKKIQAIEKSIEALQKQVQDLKE